MLAVKDQAQSLEDLFHSGTKLTYKKGEFVIRPGESPPGVFYISEGLVRAYDITKYGEMYRVHSERILNLEYRSVRERLISFLLTTARRFGEKNSDGILIKVPLRHQDVASSINSSRETTTREIAYLERNKLIINHQLYFTLTDIDKLQSYLVG